MEEKIRTFVSLDLPQEISNEIKNIQNKIKKQNLFIGKLTEPENLHLTLKFLGEIDKNTLEKVKEKLKEVKINEFEASLGEAGIFSEKFIRIIWIKIEGKEVLEFQKQIDKRLEGMFEKEFRFMGHITLARIKKVSDRKALVDYIKDIKPKNLKFKVSEFFLKKSTLMPEGPVYNVLEEYKLTGKK